MLGVPVPVVDLVAVAGRVVPAAGRVRVSVRGGQSSRLRRYQLRLFSAVRFFGTVLDGVGHYMGDMLVGQGVHRFPALALDPDQAGSPQHPQVLRDQRLAHPEPLHQLVHETRLLSELRHDRQPGGGRQHLQQLRGGLVGLRPR